MKGAISHDAVELEMGTLWQLKRGGGPYLSYQVTFASSLEGPEI